ncbi:N-acetylglucosamine-specific PTS transporter subunit IIBC [Dongshaea marina]|uniref:N-acetylglucosamine-specific PTS transporter subunit IIBC n=1 Tax=Dongshaea marina TaxID=2047966 RepID=UPI000D3E3054|nr:N-acetylglucosamine-specific PTS transporter subunit IIBC [Dongshaea marina]
MNILGGLQKLGRALMLPIAVMPVAAILLRLGQPDVFNIPFMADAGNAIFANLPILFAIGVAIGLAKDDAGAAGLAGVVGYFVLVFAAPAINKTVDAKSLSVLGGMISGGVAAWVYNRFHQIKMPEFLAFFGGKRFVPIMTALCMLVVALIFGYVWPPIQHAIQLAGEWMLAHGTPGAFVFGVLNRLLIPTGLHQVLNSLAWFVFGSYTNPVTGVVAHGDIARFFAGDPNAGMFMTGFFPVMMGGLPGACLAMYFAARKENKGKVAGLLIGVALTAFITGVTEPVEFMFMFIAPVLYVVHAILTGISLAVTTALGIHLGFGFSAGAIDFGLNFNAPAARHSAWLIPMIGIYFVLYTAIFYAVIKLLNLPTPGRESDLDDADSSVAVESDMNGLATQYLELLGGRNNLTDIDACITRLRLGVKDKSIIDDAALKALGAKGVVHLGEKNMQVILGPLADPIATEMKKMPV